MIATYADHQESELVALALRGRNAAFAEILRRHRDPVYRLIRGHLGDAEVALDLTQETFMAAHSALDRYDPERPLRAWLARIAINKCRDWARRRRVRALLLLAGPLDMGGLDVGDEAPGPWERVRDREELRAVAVAIAALPASLKEPLLLQTMEELSQAEIAHALGISPKAVETRIRRARIKLAEVIGRRKVQS